MVQRMKTENYVLGGVESNKNIIIISSRIVVSL